MVVARGRGAARDRAAVLEDEAPLAVVLADVGVHERGQRRAPGEGAGAVDEGPPRAGLEQRLEPQGQGVEPGVDGLELVGAFAADEAPPPGRAVVVVGAQHEAAEQPADEDGEGLAGQQHYWTIVC